MYQRTNHRLIIGHWLESGLLLYVVVLTIQMSFSHVLVITFYLLVLHIWFIILVVISLFWLLVFATCTKNPLITPYSLFFLSITWSLFCWTRRSDHGELAVVLATWSALFVISTDIASRILIYRSSFAAHHQRRLWNLYPFFRRSSSGFLEAKFITLGLHNILIIVLLFNLLIAVVPIKIPWIPHIVNVSASNSLMFAVELIKFIYILDIAIQILFHFIFIWVHIILVVWGVNNGMMLSLIWVRLDYFINIFLLILITWLKNS